MFRSEVLYFPQLVTKAFVCSNVCSSQDVSVLRSAEEDDRRAVGEWTKGSLESTENEHNHANVFVPRPGQPEPPKVRIRAGDHLDAQVHVVCSDCNSGWLSQIQNDAKPILIPLFEGGTITLEQTAQQMVATWVAMSTMTGEHLSQEQRRLAIPQSDRTWLIERRIPPPGWCIWIGHYPRQENPTQWVKASSRL